MKDNCWGGPKARPNAFMVVIFRGIWIRGGGRCEVFAIFVLALAARIRLSVTSRS